MLAVERFHFRRVEKLKLQASEVNRNLVVTRNQRQLRSNTAAAMYCSMLVSFKSLVPAVSGKLVYKEIEKVILTINTRTRERSRTDSMLDVKLAKGRS